MPLTLFLSDIHLQADEAHPINCAFRHFLKTLDTHVEALYLLGDTFESWVGDDVGLQQYQQTLAQITAVINQGVKVYMQFGNRDFLMKAPFWQQTGIVHLPDPCAITLYNQSLLLLHGDSLCTDDLAYQKMRKWVRNPIIQWLFLKLPKSKRLAIAYKMRTQSKNYNQTKTPAWMDVNEQAIAQLLARFPQVQTIVHGHTHQPAVHSVHHQPSVQRIVLGDWRCQKMAEQAPGLVVKAHYLILSPTQMALCPFQYSNSNFDSDSTQSS